ncbi:MAG TPA: hypothetical protein VJH33_02875 [Candidatus Paceibacterota bacterium]
MAESVTRWMLQLASELAMVTPEDLAANEPKCSVVPDDGTVLGVASEELQRLIVLRQGIRTQCMALARAAIQHRNKNPNDLTPFTDTELEARDLAERYTALSSVMTECLRREFPQARGAFQWVLISGWRVVVIPLPRIVPPGPFEDAVTLH